MALYCPYNTKHIQLVSLPLSPLPSSLDNVWNRFKTSMKRYIMNIDLNIKINCTVPISRKQFPCAFYRTMPKNVSF